MYSSVILVVLWPSRICTSLRLAPKYSDQVPKLCRKVWADSRTSVNPARFFILLNIMLMLSSARGSPASVSQSCG